MTTSISGFYKTSPLLAGLIVGLVSRITQYSSRKDTKSFSLNNIHNNNSKFAIVRVLCSGLVLGILFEIMIHGNVIFSICELSMYEGGALQCTNLYFKICPNLSILLTSYVLHINL